MKPIVIVTLVLDGEPWIEKHLPIFKQLKRDWKWIIVHGASMNGGSTRWCQPQEPRLSNDGTTDYLSSIRDDARLTVIEKESWDSKDSMVNAALAQITERCVLMEIDSDEIWTADQIEKICEFIGPYGSIRFRCRYFVGTDLIVTDNRGVFGDRDYEWVRVWWFTPGDGFTSHEPPVLTGKRGSEMSKDDSEKWIGRFDHMAYATEAQVAFKQSFYGYRNLVNQWKALQSNTHWPAKLSRFFPFAEGGSVEKITSPVKA